MTHIATESGHWVSADFQYLAEVLEDYDPTLELRWIPPDSRTTPHERANPWAVFQRGILVFLCSEKDKPYQILGKVIAGDQKQGDVLKRIDEAEAKAKKLLEYKQMIAMAEAKEEFEWLIKNANSGRNYIKHNGRKLDGNSLREIPNSGKVILP